MQVSLDIAVACGLVIVLFVVAVFDDQRPLAVAPPPTLETATPEPQPEPPSEAPVIQPPEEFLPPIDPIHRVVVKYSDDARTGLSTTTGNPDDATDDNKLLTYSENGATNNARLWVDGSTPIVGSNRGHFVRRMETISDGRLEAEWAYDDVNVVKSVDFVASDVSHRIDGIRVDYRLRNVGTTTREVGLRIMIDSLIGENDGVPFIVPGRKRIVTSPLELSGKEIPDFVRALEVPDLVNPGVIVDLSLRSTVAERPSEVVLTHWPGSSAEWMYGRTEPFGHDTAIGLYYVVQPMKPGDERLMSFNYGLGTISSTQSKNARLSLTAGGPFRAGGSFWLVALVQDPDVGQSVRLELPEGLTLDVDDQLTKEVMTDDAYCQISWLLSVDPGCFGAARINVTLEPDGISEEQELAIEPRDEVLTLAPQGPFRQGKPFWVVALVQVVQEGQQVELLLPDGLHLARGHESKQAAEPKPGFTQVNWLVNVSSGQHGRVAFSARLLPDGVEATAEIDIQPGSLID
jgi:hypothetical protein